MPPSAASGLSLDSPSAQCAPARDLSEQPAWYRLRAGFHPALEAANGAAGTIRYGVYTDWAADALKATDLPRAFLDAPDTLAASPAKRSATGMATSPGRKAIASGRWAAIDPAIRATAAWLVARHRLPADQAERAAERIVAGWVGGRLGFIADQ